MEWDWLGCVWTDANGDGGTIDESESYFLVPFSFKGRRYCVMAAVVGGIEIEGVETQDGES